MGIFFQNSHTFTPNDLKFHMDSSLELETFKNQAGEVYVYANIPSATHTGHYASKWNKLDDWDAIVTCKLSLLSENVR